ncbi:MAG: hypothetical protein OEZ68_01395 [Gammaproteobacteria bacterium]|nr:hypothetical protein [Gammaproteobacteria bacterium]
MVNADNTQSVSKQQIKNIYADITAAWSDGEQITVFHLPVDDDAREVFSQAIFGESAEKQAAAELNRKITNTIKNPSKTKSANLVKKMVKRDPKAIGYIPKSSLGASKGLRVVLTLQSP